MVTKPARVIAYYVAVVAGALIVHQSWLADLVGADVVDLLRRNSEAYALMVLVPLFWDVFGPSVGPTNVRSVRTVSERSGSQLLWFGLLLLGAVVLESQPEGWPAAITTLGEAFVGALFITAYVAWSRGFLFAERAPDHGGPVVSWPTRAVYYGVVAGWAIAIQQQLVIERLPGGVVEVAELNIEAYGAMLVIPLFFDLFAHPQRFAWVAIWIAMLVAVPILSQPGVIETGPLSSLAGWTVRATEAFVAAIGVTVYFRFWRPAPHR